MTVLSIGMELVRQWLPSGSSPRASIRARGSLALELRATVTIAGATDDRIEASIAGRIRVAGKLNAASSGPVRQNGAGFDPESNPAELRVEDRRLSSGALADARPFLWLRLTDERGGALSHETFIGRGVGIEHDVHALIHLGTLVETAAPAPAPNGQSDASHRPPAHTALTSGLRARIVARTYRNSTEPHYQVEILTLRLLESGTAFPGAKSLE